ncbi:MAG: NADH-quinone oxidoreductase subunit NuoE [Candidatus Atribacteria bacterium]|nr:NADH-quinone oxidoreductase subunit NuoE [Candidatus Atribacteria bacterium]
MMEESLYREIEEIIEKYREEETPLLCVLQEVQEKFHYLPRNVLGYIAKKMNVPSSTVYGVATFYSFFETNPVGEYVIRVCKSTPCHVQGAFNVLQALKRELGLKEGETSKDGKFTLEVTSCLGVCGVAPAMMINDVTYGNLNDERVREILALYRR